MAFLKQEAPEFDGRTAQEEKLDRIADFLAQHMEELQYVLRHLSGENFTESAWAGVQETLTFDGAPQEDSENPVTSGGLYTALEGKQNALTFDSEPLSGSGNPVTSGGVYAAVRGKQDALTFDGAPTQGSLNPVTSGGVYAALENAGGVTIDTLWTNADPSAGISSLVLTTASGLSAAPKDYDLLLIEFCYWTDASASDMNEERGSVLVPYRLGKKVHLGMNYGNQYGSWRRITLAALAVVIGQGYDYAGTADDDACIPTKIIGIKG